jgi:predicted molibdopterin-dependent oxidoreductase YjgC
VTLNGASQIVSSCAYTAVDGLDVKTDTEKIHKIRQFLVQLLLSEAPQAQVLQELAQELGVERNERFEVHNELCIACGQCIRACAEIVGVSAINFADRGYNRTAAAPFFQRSEDCIGCGTCVAVCPTGAVAMKDLIEGEKGTVPDGETIKGPARIIENWKVGFEMKNCEKCGEPFAPQTQLDYIRKRADLPKDFFESCVNCRE